MDAERLQFAQQQQTENMVNVGIRQHDACDRGLAHTVVHSIARVKISGGFNLRAQVWGRSQQKPRVAVLTDGDLGLSARLTLECACSQATAVGTGAIPLGKSTTCSRAQDFHSHPKGVYNAE